MLMERPMTKTIRRVVVTTRTNATMTISGTREGYLKESSLHEALSIYVASYRDVYGDDVSSHPPVKVYWRGSKEPALVDVQTMFDFCDDKITLEEFKTISAQSANEEAS